MKITREIIINSESQQVSYELTGIELERCYNEYVSREEKNAIVNRLDEDEFERIMDIPDDLIQRMAEKYHKFLDEYSADVKSAAMNDVLEKFGTELEPYKEKWKVFTKTIHVEANKEYTIKARNESEADAIWERWSERHGDRITEDMCEEVQYNGDWDWDYDMEEDEYGDPDDADIKEDD